MPRQKLRERSCRATQEDPFLGGKTTLALTSQHTAIAMGNAAFFRAALSVHASAEVEGASCETMWQTRYDVEKLPSITPSHILAVETLARPTPPPAPISE